jgi:hypothetical protein
LTQRNQLRWLEDPNAVTRASTPGPNPHIKLGPPVIAYRAQYKDKWFRVLQNAFGLPENNYSLEITDAHGQTLFVVPEAKGLNDLLHCIQYQAAGIDELIESLVMEAKL